MRLVARAAIALVLAIVVVAAAIRYVFPQAALALALDAEHWRAGLVKREVTLPDGLTMSYLEGGRGEVVVLLHGFGADKDNFLRIAPFLEPHYRVIVPDLIGFGDSSRPADADYSPAAQAERVRAFCKAIGLPSSFHLGGSSMGGQIALTLAAAHPHEVRSLWLLDPGGLWSAPDSEVTRALRRGARNPLLVDNEDDFADLLGLVMTRPPPIPRFLQDAMAQRRIANRALEERIQRQMRADSIEGRIQGLRTSTLVVFGAEDRVVNPATAALLKKLMPRAHVVIMPGVGHLPALEAPEHAASDYVRFRDSM